MVKRISRKIAVILAMVMMLTCFAYTVPVNAAGKADMEKANVKWDLKNNKKLTYKQYWYSMGVKKHTVKMTNFKIRNAKKKGFKECTFTLTYKMKVNPTRDQILKMGRRCDQGKLFTQWGFCVVDYQTGKSLEQKNDKGVKTTWKIKSYNYAKLYGTNGSWIRYPQKQVFKVKITYPKDYKDLTIGVVGSTKANLRTADAHWAGKLPFSKATALYSKKDKAFAHFMRVK